MSAAGGALRRAGRPTSVQAIVLRRRDFRESSRLVTCLTREQGKVTGLAKGPGLCTAGDILQVR